MTMNNKKLQCPKCKGHNIIYLEDCYQNIGFTCWSAKHNELNYDGSTNGFGNSDGVMDGEKIYKTEYYCGDCCNCSSKTIKKFQPSS